MLFRQHRGDLVDSMLTVKEVHSLEDVQNIVPLAGNELKCKWYAKDDRIGWDTWIITDQHGVLGFSNGELK